MTNQAKSTETTTSGYTPCGCRDCMEIAIGAVGALCHECETAGCEGGEDGGECQAPGAYGGDDSDESEPVDVAATVGQPGAQLLHDITAPLPWAVWFEDEILGAGNTPAEAIAEARETVDLHGVV